MRGWAGREPLAAALVLGAVAAGIGLRAWVLATPLGALDADEAVWGLMAKHALDGELSTFFWGQSYGGTQEALLTAVVFALTGSSALVLKLVPIGLFALAAVLVWRVGRRTVGEPAARMGALLFWVWPSYLVWKSTKAHGFYGSALVLGLVIVLLVLRLRERDSRRDLVLLGLAIGIGWWATPQIAFLAVPALAWLAWQRRTLLRSAWLVLAAGLVGAAPWLVWNLEHDWFSFKPGPEPGDDTYLGHLEGFFAANLPTALGLRVPFSLEWLTGPLLGRALETLALLAFAWLVVRRRRERLGLLLLAAAAYPFLSSFSPFAALVDEPRYLVLLAPLLALLLARAIERPVPAVLGLLVAVGLSIAGLVEMERDGRTAPLSGGARVPAELGPVLRVLEEEGVERVRAEYWIAYRITFESGERVIAASTSQVRHEPYQALVERSARPPARVYVAGSDAARAARRRLAPAGYRAVEAGGWTVYLPPS